MYNMENIFYNQKEKLDQYANLMTFAKIAELLKSENSNNKEK